MNHSYGESTKPDGSTPRKTLSLGYYPGADPRQCQADLRRAHATAADGRDPAIERHIKAKLVLSLAVKP